MTPPIVLTIAGHDPLGGAGVAADLTTFAAMGTHGMVVLTAVTAQRFGVVEQVQPVAPDLLAAQIDAVLADCRPAAVKIGLLPDVSHVGVVAERVADGRLLPPVVDPVMVDGSGRRFVSPEVEHAWRSTLFPRTAVLTPNRAEAELLGPSTDALAALGAGLVVVTGGGSGATDLLVSASGDVTEMPGDWIETENVRGSGCTFAAALAAGLALGRGPVDAAATAKAFVTARLRDGAEWSIAPAGCAGPVSHRFVQGT